MAWSVTADVLEFAEAVAWFRKRVSVTRAEWDKMNAEARKRAFVVSNVAQLDLVHQVFKAIDAALATGASLEDFKKSIGGELRKAWRGSVADSPWRLETIFRTNAQNSYAAGRYKQATHPDVVEDRPVWMFDAILDGRETPVCAACDGTKLPADDDWWKSHLPPLHFNCRSAFITMTAKQAGKLSAAPTVNADDGFGSTPGDSEWEPDLSKYAPELADAYRKKTA